MRFTYEKGFYALLGAVIYLLPAHWTGVYEGVEIESAHQSAMLTMVDKYIADTKDVPKTKRCIQVLDACEFHFLRTGN